MLKEYKIKYNQNLYDICVILYGGLDYLSSLFQYNLFITDYNMDLSMYAGISIIYEDSLSITTPVEISSAAQSQSTTETKKFNKMQSIYDACTETYGSLDYMIRMLQDNKISNLNYTDVSQKNIIFTLNKIKDNSIKTVIEKKRIRYVTLTGITGYRITEDNRVRITEDGQIRILEN
jgi:hypothetical protein